MAREYGVDNGDGTITVWGTDDAGNFWPIRTESRAQNQGTVNTQNTPPPTTGGGFTTGGGAGFLPGALDAATAAAQQAYLRDRMRLLEIPMSQAERAQAMAQLTGYYKMGAPATTGMSEEQALDYIWQNKPDLAGFFQANGWDISTPDRQRAAVQNWINSVDPSHRGKSAVQVAQELGAQTEGGGGWNGAGAGQEGALPTFEREQWNRAGEQWQKQFDTSNNQWTASFLGSKSGPRDYALYSQLQPKTAFGAVQGGPSWEQSLAQFWNGSRQAPGVSYRQPGSISASEMNSMTPTARAMRESEWAYNGLDSGDMWAMAQKARPTGQAALNTMWR